MVVKYETKKIDMNIFILRIKYPQLELPNRVFNLMLTNTTTNNTKFQLYYSSNISNVCLSVMPSSLISHSELDSTLSGICCWFSYSLVDSECGTSIIVHSESRGSISSKGSKHGRFFDPNMIASKIPGLTQPPCMTFYPFSEVSSLYSWIIQFACKGFIMVNKNFMSMSSIEVPFLSSL